MISGKLYLILAGISIFTFSSCRRDYTCTCTTTVVATHTTKTYELPNKHHADAKRDCNRIEADANSNSLGTTTCDL